MSAVVTFGSRLVDSPMFEVLWPVKDGGGGSFQHFVREEKLTKGQLGLAGWALCGRKPDTKWTHLSRPAERTCNACLAESCKKPSRLKFKDRLPKRKR